MRPPVDKPPVSKGVPGQGRKEVPSMISANIDNKLRKSIYARDGYRCALCDDTRTIQIHHVVKRSVGGGNHPHNLICLCSNCHALAHGTNLQGWVDVTQEHIEQAIVEYLADYYADLGEVWNPYRKGLPPFPNERL